MTNLSTSSTQELSPVEIKLNLSKGILVASSQAALAGAVKPSADEMAMSAEVYANEGLEKKGEAYNLKVILHPVTNKSEGLKYIFNRRMLLHQNFQNEIAPYFGVITLNQACLQLVDTKGDLVEPNKNESYTKLSFAAKSDYTLFDCASDQFSATLTYYFHYCANKKTVYETRFSKKISADIGLKISCN